jgi:hypothetical protein
LNQNPIIIRRQGLGLEPSVANSSPTRWRGSLGTSRCETKQTSKGNRGNDRDLDFRKPE